MARKTQQNSITSPELIAQINPENIRLLEDYITYLKSIQRSENTLKGYLNDLHIFLVWNMQNNKNKLFTEISKRDIISYQNWLLNNNKNSPARVRRLKSTLSSLSNYIENILDDEFEGYRSIIKKVESPINQPVREKTILEDEQIDKLLEYLVEKKHYAKACCLALATCSGRRKSELLRFKVNYFNDENIIYGSLYKTPEKVLTKGRGLGKWLTVYVMSNKFKPYLDLWLEQRKELGIESEWLFPLKNNDNDEKGFSTDTLNSWALTFTKFLGVDFYWHSLRHHFCTALARLNIPDSVIKEIIGWESLEMVQLYKDLSADEEIGKYFDENGVKEVKQGKLTDLQ